MVINEQVKQRSRQGIEWLARGSYMAKAIFYGTIAFFTVQLALGSRGPDPSRKQVLEALTSNTLGQILLALMALALAGHTLWRVIEIWADPYQKGTGPGGWLYRLNYLLSGITYGSLGLTAVKLLTGGGSGQNNQKQIWVARLLQWEGGKGVIIGISLIFLAWAGLQIYKGLSGSVYKSMELDQLGSLSRGFLRVSGLLGFVTVGASLAGTGWYLLKGAWTENPKWVKNMDDLIKLLQGLPGGWWLQLGVSLGFLLMGVFMLAMARYFPLKASD